MKFSLSAALAIALGALIAGCGQKGALVLPDQAKHRKIPQVPRPQPNASPAAPKGTAPSTSPDAAPGSSDTTPGSSPGTPPGGATKPPADGTPSSPSH